jgi:multidrug resistance protein MdtO
LPPAAATALAETLDAIAAILAAGSYPVEIEPPPQPPDLSPEAAIWWAEMRASLVGFADPASSESSPNQAKTKSGGLLVADAFTNPVHVHHALKTTGAAMFCYILYSLLDWPTIHTCLITCYIVGLGTAAETVEKLSLRILGCLLGAAAGIGAIVFLIPDLTSIGSLMITVFLAALGSAWIAGGDTRISYAGFQLAFAFFLCVLQGSGPSFDMVTARDRVIGILLGNIVTYLVFTRIRPVSVARRIDPAIAALLRNWSALLRGSRQQAILSASQALLAAGTLERDLELIDYEPESIRPPREWVAGRRRAVANLRPLAGVLWLSARQDPKLSEEVSTRLDHAAGLIGEPNTHATRPETPPIATTSAAAADTPSLDALRGFVEIRLQMIESSLNDRTENGTALTHATL